MMSQTTIVTAGCTTVAVLGQVPLNVLLAQSPAPVIGSGEEFIWRISSTLGALGILAWYFYITQTKTIPSKDAEIAAERAASDAKMKTTVELATAEIHAERAANAVTVDKILDELREERNARMTIIEKCKGHA